MPPIERPAARYRQVADDLREAINRGDYSPGDPLPSQPSLARKYRLNQTSINRAIRVLEAEGRVWTEHGRGSWVVDVPAVKRVRHIPPRGAGSGSSFAESMQKLGRAPRTELVQAEIIDPPPEIAKHLDLPPGERTLIRKRHMFGDENPVQLAVSYIPLEFAGGVDLAYPDTGPRGIHKRLEERGFKVVRFVEEIEVRRPTLEEADFLRLSSAQYVLEVVRLAFDQTGRRLEAVTNVLPAQLWRLTYQWGAEEGMRSPETDPPRHSVSVTGVVVRPDGRVLAIKRDDDGRWVPPGGVLELSETPAQGVVREVLEETGIEIAPERLIGAYKNMTLGVVTLAFLCRPVGGLERESDESDAVVWLTPEQATEIMPEARSVRVTDAFRDDGPFVRVHDGNILIHKPEE